jgi:hypothetical protein
MLTATSDFGKVGIFERGWCCDPFATKLHGTTPLDGH